MKPRDRMRYQRHSVGFVWQQTSRNLLPYLSAAENIAMAMAVAGTKNRRGRVAELLDLLEVGHCADRLPAQLSGGEQQRTAIAVALSNSPEVLLADEPTGELDEATSFEVLEAMRGVNEQLGVTTLIVTHDPAVSSHVRRAIQIRDGRTSTEVLRRSETDATGQEHHIAEEYAVLDRVGRLQLPDEFTTTLGLRDRVRLALESDHVGVLARATGGATAARSRLREDSETGSTRRGRAMTAATAPVLRAVGVSRDFGTGAGVVHACRDIDLEVSAGELLIVRGRSGSGKTTLLGMLGTLDRPTSGQVWLGDRELSALGEDALTGIRREHIGFVFQTFGLIPVLSAAENVEIPLRIRGVDPRAAAGHRARDAGAGRAWPTTPSSGRTSCPAGSSSGSGWRGRWPPSRTSCSPTSRPVSWTAARRPR